MSTNEQTPLSQPTFVVSNTLGKAQVPQNLGRSISNEAPREYCDKNYHQILSIIAKKVHQEKVQQEKLKAIKARLNFEESSWHSESGTPSRKRDLKERLEPRHARSRSESHEPRGTELASEKHRKKRVSSRSTEALSESEGSAGGHLKSRPKRQKSSVEDDLSQPWAAAKMERWAMPTWCHMFNSTLTGNAKVWFDDLSQESIDSYNDLRKAFLENYL
nr:reverse transcriptase domain-containing protein [Tanacetum cinerariifolium]